MPESPADHLDALRQQLDSGFGKMIGLEFDELGPDRVTARWTIRPELHQPFGIVHGGVYCAVVESVASTAAAVWLGDRGNVVGVNNNTDFIRAVRDGVLTAEATPVHRGRTQQIWIVTIIDGSDRLIARGQVRLQNIQDTGTIGSS
ncbi:MAG: PaaI family thioesterase [Rhodococcus sp. (in: high G+C Gram-positive bacteria)]